MIRILVRLTALLVLAPVASGAVAEETRRAGALAEVVRDAKVREAALRSIEGSIAALEQDLAPATRVAERMLADARTYADPELARARIEAEERAALRRAFRAQLEAFARNRDEALPPTWVDDVLRDESARVDATIDQLIVGGFEERFRAGRAAAVTQQRASVALQYYPPGSAILELVGDPTDFAKAPNGRAAELAAGDAAKALANATVARIRAATPLLAEIDAGLESDAAAAVAAGLAELWRQLGSVERFEPVGAVRQVDITAALAADLSALARASGLPYGVFPEVEARIPERAAALERKRLVEHVGAQLKAKDGCPALPAAAVAAQAGSDIATMPMAFAAHADALRAALWPEIRSRLVAAHAATLPAAERLPFVQRIDDLLAADAEVQRQTQGAFGACLEPALRAHREQLARDELTAALPTIADLSFEIADDDLITLALSEDEVDPGLFPTATLQLEESQALFAARIAALHREARAAVRAQELLTRAQERRSRFVDEVENDSNRTAERKQHFQKEYESEVLDAWRQRRSRILLQAEAGGGPLHPEKYGRIFPTTAEIIDEIITIEFERPAPTVTIAPTRPSPPTEKPTPLPTPVPPSPQPTPKIEKSGPAKQPNDAGLPVRSEKPLPLPQTGGAPAVGPGAGTGGPKSCEDKLQLCRRATTLCHAAVIQCRDGAGDCGQSLARCGEAKFACEQAK